MAELTRRDTLGAGVATLGCALGAPALSKGSTADVIVVGAGVFGVWTAHALQAAGRKVMLVDAWSPGHARASSGGESRMTRGSYGADEVYTRMAWDSLADWRALSARAELPLFHRSGVLFFFPRMEEYAGKTMEVHRRLKLPTELLDNKTMARRFPQVDFTGVEISLFEAEFGALMARRSVETLAAEFVAAGGAYRRAAIAPPEAGTGPLARITTSIG